MLLIDNSDAGKKDAHAVRCALKDKLQLFEEVMSDEKNSADFKSGDEFIFSSSAEARM